VRHHSWPNRTSVAASKRLVIMHSGWCKFDHELGYQFCCWIVLNDEPELLADGQTQLTYSEGFRQERLSGKEWSYWHWLLLSQAGALPKLSATDAWG
jgi:hypothetical protein